MDPEVDFVSLLGQAGTGKTLLTLASALMQTLETKRYMEIIMTRMTVPVGEDIGFLPGTEEEKMSPWMGALEDNLDVLQKPRPTHAPGAAPPPRLLRSASSPRLHARRVPEEIPHIDEANLSRTRSKPSSPARTGSKIVACNIAQIDAYLTETTSGLTSSIALQ
jgi:PhoH-like ATPase